MDEAGMTSRMVHLLDAAVLFYRFISVFLLSQTGAQNSQPVQQYS